MSHPIPHWYKSSSLWPIPQDWDVLELGHLCKTISSWKSKTLNEWWKYPIYWSTWIIGYSKTLDYQWKSILVARVWANAWTVNYVDGEYAVSDNTLMVQLKEWSSLFRYIYYSLVWYKLNKLVFGSGQPLITWWQLKSLKLPLPPRPEQHAIASILSTCDESITTIQTLIDRLQRRHKALCQQLLTGKKRLQWFSEVFKKLQADEIFKNVSIKNNPWERLLSATQDQWIIPRDMLEWRVTMPTTEANSYKLVQPWNFVISLRSFQWWLEYSTYRGIVSPAYTVLEPILPINDDFYKYYFKSYDFIWHLAVAVIGIRDWKQISFDNFCALSLPYPSPEEQTAIASILNESQTQIDLAQAKLTKLKQHKQGLMQQLLTGKTRIPSEYL